MKTFSKTPGGETMVEVPCPVCGSVEHRPYWDCGSFAFERCRSCGLVYQNPQPVQGELSQRYDEEYLDYETANEEGFYHLMELGLRDMGFHDLEFDGSKRFLDVGCATGRLLYAMKGRGWEEQGVEICEPAARWGMENRGVRIHVGELADASFPANHFDVVHSSHVIEHLTRPDLFVSESLRILRPGGYFICTTPNTAGFQAKLFGAQWRSAIADHVCLFSKRNLRRLLEERGLQVLRTGTWGGLAVGAAPRWLKGLADPLAKRFGFGDVMIFLCRKPAG